MPTELEVNCVFVSVRFCGWLEAWLARWALDSPRGRVSAKDSLSEFLTWRSAVLQFQGPASRFHSARLLSQDGSPAGIAWSVGPEHGCVAEMDLSVRSIFWMRYGQPLLLFWDTFARLYSGGMVIVAFYSGAAGMVPDPQGGSAEEGEPSQ